MKAIKKDKIAKLEAVQSNNNSLDPSKIALIAEGHIEKESKTPEFPLTALPSGLQSIIQTWCDCYLLPADYYAASVLAAASGIIGNRFRIEYKLFHQETAMVWICIVGAPGIGKTPAIKFAMQPLFDQEHQFGEEHERNLKEWEREKINNSNSSIKVQEKPRPKRRQRIVNDATIESLIKILPYNKEGTISYRDEFTGWFKSMNAYKQGGSDLEHWLSIWSNSPIMLNRVSSEDPIFIKSPFVSAIGGIQPGVLHTLTDNNKIDNGFVSRILFAYPDNQEMPPESNILPDQSVFDHYRQIMHNLDQLPATEDGKPYVLLMCQEARKRYQEYKEEKRQIINSNCEEIMRSVYVKLLSYTLRFSLINELLELASESDELFIKHLSEKDIIKNCISKTAVERAISITEYFEATTKKVLSSIESPVSSLNARNKALYEALPNIVPTSLAIQVGEKLHISTSTVKRLLYNRKLFKQTPDGQYRKLYT